MQKKPCAGCGKPITRYSLTGYCIACVNVAKKCNSCDARIAAFNRSGLCFDCQHPKKG